jgi:hypothetical protein
VLATAVRRIEIADFSFFCVCLLLQRETGGQLGETLENLATSCGRAGKFARRPGADRRSPHHDQDSRGHPGLSSCCAMYFTEPTYMMVLFGTGRRVRSCLPTPHLGRVRRCVDHQDVQTGYLAMKPGNIETLINLLMLLALFAGLAIWWATKHGGRRGRIADRVREAAITQQTDEQAFETEEERKRLSAHAACARLAAFGDKLPLFDAKYRAKLKKEMAAAAIAATMRCRFCLPSSLLWA